MDSAIAAIFSSAFDIKFIVKGGERMPLVPLCNGGLIWRGEINGTTVDCVWV
jgi:hypothetical protein